MALKNFVTTFNTASMNGLNLCLVIFISLVLGCVCNRTNKMQVPEGKALPIDGTWTFYSNPQTILATLKMEKGRAYSVNGGTTSFPANIVAFKDVQKSADDAYSAIYINAANEMHPANLIVVSDSIIEVRIPELGILWSLKKISLDDGQAFEATHKFPQNNQTADKSAERGNVELISFTEEREKAFEQEMNPGKGSQFSVLRSRTIEHSVGFESTTATEVTAQSEVSGRIKGSIIVIEKELAIKLALGIRRKIEEKLSRKFETQETFSVTVVLDGNKSPKWKLIWYDRVQKGVARYTDENGKQYDIPYKFPVMCELDSIAVE